MALPNLESVESSRENDPTDMANRVLDQQRQKVTLGVEQYFNNGGLANRVSWLADELLQF